MGREVTEAGTKIRHVTSICQFENLDVLDNLFLLADKMQAGGDIGQPLAGKTLATIFFEPSTRTRLSFETAMHKLGGNVITTENAEQSSSISKGESLQDTIRTVANYADAIVLRHPEVRSSAIAASVSPVPIINAGDGAGEHPTQALLDLYTLKTKLGNINNIRIALVGDLLYSRTVHSLLKLLAMYKGVEVFLVSPSSLKIPRKYVREMNIQEIESIREVKTKLDVMYVTRMQRERFNDKKQYEKLKEAYVVTSDTLSVLKKDGILMNPLPRLNEISPEVDDDKRAVYFEQAQNGVYVRMALLSMILGD